MLKKILILSLVIAAGVCPFLPKVFADNASWKTLLADRVWDQSTFRVDRLTYNSGVSDPMKRNGVAYVSNPSTLCTDLGTCDRIDLSLVKDGKSQTVNGVDQQFLNPSFSMAQKEKFVYFTKSTDPNKWFDVSFVDPNTSETHVLTSLARKPNELSFISFSTSGDRLYTSLLQSNKDTKQVQSSIVAKSNDGAYEERNIAFLLNAPWQQVMDGYNDQLLVKLQFHGGNKQLWLINPQTQVMSAIPNTWTDPQGDILFAHFLSNGKIVFFQNYRLYTYDPGNDKQPLSHGNAVLSWSDDVNQNVQILGDTMAWTDVNHVLYAVTPEGVTELHAIKAGSVHLEKDAMYYADAKGSWRYEFSSKKTTQTLFLVTDVLGDLRVGTDTKGTVWFQNTTNNNLVNLGFGEHPVMSDENHVIWKGTDGAIYQATLSTLLSMQRQMVAAFRSSDSKTVYLATNTSLWSIPDEQTYFTWFPSWNRVTTISPQMFASIEETHALKGDAGFAPGTRVKAVGDARVYMVGNDGQMHWIVSETVANTIYGSKWNKGIMEVPSTFLWRYSNGVNVSSEQNVKTL